jgi:hypothetical protein
VNFEDNPMDRTLSDYFCCPEEFTKLETGGSLSGLSGFFEFGQGVTCFGQYAGGPPPTELGEGLPDALESVRIEGDRFILPFDLAQVVANLRRERYLSNSGGANGSGKGNASRRIYYFLRPILPVAVRKHLQRIRLKGWDDIPFPRWPVDFTVESLMEQTLSMILRSGHVSRIPFIWFWPQGIASGAMMTHDVEAVAGLSFVPELMDLDDSFGIKSSFQVVPEVRYNAGKEFLDSVRARGFEVNVHDLNHDGALYAEKAEFLRRAVLINHYATEFRTGGFRAGAMYRNQDWYDAFNFSYDMSVPNVAHLEPQRGGCCTVMPYFIGKVLELPLTTIQDYSLFHILGDYSIDLWKSQIDLILKRNGLVSFIVHPDYVIDKRAQQVYAALLRHIAQLRDDGKIWVALPNEVNQWWRERSQMKLVRAGDDWKIEGPGSERARIAYAALEAGRLVYQIPSES